jgi:3-oxoacyl-[acyl-carrier protein] reductase
MADLDGRVAIVTGATAGVGRGIATVLARNGAKILVVARRPEPIEEFVAELSALHGSGSAAGVAADVGTAQGVDAVFDAVRSNFGQVDIVVNNAGRPAHRPFGENDDQEWQYDFDLKVMAAVRMSRMAYPLMKDRGTGRILNILSLGAKIFPENSTPTAVTRAGGLALTKVLSKEFAKGNVLVNAILLAYVRSSQHERRWLAGGQLGTLEDAYAKMAQSVPLGRVAEPEEVGELAAFLASNRASYITGAAINCDGGMSPVA